MLETGRPETVYISVAANIDPEENIPRALDLLREKGKLKALSTFYRTQALARPEQPDYLNGVICFLTPQEPRALKFETLRPIETTLGRVRRADKYAARSMDLDILLFGDRVQKDPELQIPDPDLRSRIFLLIPLLELAPDLALPDTGETLAELVAAVKTPIPPKAVAFSQTLRERYIQ